MSQDLISNLPAEGHTDTTNLISNAIPSSSSAAPRQVHSSSSQTETARASSSLPLSFLLPSLWSRNPSAASLASTTHSATGETTPASDLSGQHVAQRTAALRRLNGPPQHHSPRPSRSSTGSTASSQPVLVRTYSRASRSKDSSRRRVPAIREEERMDDAKLPPIEAFSFNGIMKSIEPEIEGTLDAITAICANSRYSLSNQYEVHMPPHVAARQVGGGQLGIGREGEQGHLEDGDAVSIDQALAQGRGNLETNNTGPGHVGHAPSSQGASSNVIMTRGRSTASEALLRHATNLHDNITNPACPTPIPGVVLSASFPEEVQSAPASSPFLAATSGSQVTAMDSSSQLRLPTILFSGFATSPSYQAASASTSNTTSRPPPLRVSSSPAAPRVVSATETTPPMAETAEQMPTRSATVTAHEILTQNQSRTPSERTRQPWALNKIFSWLSTPSTDNPVGDGNKPTGPGCHQDPASIEECPPADAPSAEDSLKTLLDAAGTKERARL